MESWQVLVHSLVGQVAAVPALAEILEPIGIPFASAARETRLQLHRHKDLMAAADCLHPLGSLAAAEALAELVPMELLVRAVQEVLAQVAT
jgi:hypothetical protein